MSSRSQPYLVGIAGGSASGKTSLLRDLFKMMPKGSLALVSQDNYYKPKEEQKKDRNGELNFDLPTSIDRRHFHHDVQRLRIGKSITKLEYTFNNPDKEPEKITIHPAPIVICEGLFIFHYKEINDLLDYKVYVEADEKLRLKRRITRDMEERGYPEKVVRYQWENHVLPADRNFLQPYRSQCDEVIHNNISYNNELHNLVKKLKAILHREPASR